MYMWVCVITLVFYIGLLGVWGMRGEKGVKEYRYKMKNLEVRYVSFLFVLLFFWFGYEIDSFGLWLVFNLSLEEVIV